MARHNKFKKTADQLSDMYLKQGLSVEQIAQVCGCKTDTVRVHLARYGIVKFSRGGQVAWNIDEGTLRKLYHDEKKGIPEIAKILGCGETTVFRKVHEYGLQIDAAELGQRKTAHNTARREGWTHKRLSGGYNFIKRIGHPLANSAGYISEHRINAEEAMGRKLKPSERIHHINLHKRDNKPENLAVLPSQAVHRMVHNYLGRCGSFLCGLTAVRPEPLAFGQPVFWGGKYVTQLDLLSRAPLDFLGHDELLEPTSAKPVVN